MKDGELQRAPSFLSGEVFRVHLTDVKVQLLGCGCWIPAVDGPNMVFAIEGSEEPVPTIRMWCQEVGAFPMEWFYRPLLDATQLRILLVKEFRQEMVFDGDELHWTVNFQMPKPSAVLRRFGRLVCGMVIKNVKAPLDEDPLNAMLDAIAEDCHNLEADLQDGEVSNGGAGSRQISDSSKRSSRSAAEQERTVSSTRSARMAASVAGDLESGAPSSDRSPSKSVWVVQAARRWFLCLCCRRARSRHEESESVPDDAAKVIATI
jgi:hypothetical protein